MALDQEGICQPHRDEVHISLITHFTAIAQNRSRHLHRRETLAVAPRFTIHAGRPLELECGHFG
jgi:hypothetical protein